MSLLFKVCGIALPEQALCFACWGVPYLGFIYYEGSPRFVGNDFCMPEKLSARKVGVFVDASIDTIAMIALRDGLDVVQLHGQESPAFCRELQLCTAASLWKVFRLSHQPPDINYMAGYEPFVDAFLFDTAGKQAGGNGYAFDWRLLAHYSLQKPFWLSGGVGLHNLQEAMELVHLYPGLPLVGLDLNSHLEIQPGIKDPEKVKRLIQQMKSNLQHL